MQRWCAQPDVNVLNHVRPERRADWPPAVLLVSSFVAGQGIQEWRAPDGQLHLGDNPPPGSEKIGESEWQVDASRFRDAEAPDSLAPSAGGRSSPSTSDGRVGEHAGRVVGVSDGDTITVLVDRREVRVRLAEIDTPEHGQPYGTRAKQVLAELVFGKQVRVAEVDRDRYGRVVGRVYVDGLDVNAEMVISDNYFWTTGKSNCR